MGDNDGARIPTIDPRPGRQFLEVGRLGQGVDMRRADEGSTAKGDGFIAVIESRMFLQECIGRSVQSTLSLPVVAYSAALEVERQLGDASAQLVILSLVEGSNEEYANACKILSELAPGAPIIVLAHKNDADLARTAIRHGAKGYIPWTMGFEIAIQVMRFVLAGGTYVPVDCMLAPSPPGPPARPQIFPSSSDITRRELAVVRAIQKGRSNKAIAYELNMCESTVKVHVRNVMKKWRAKNRTEVAIRAQNYLGADVEGSEAA